jgi:hypothetical protein
MRAFFLICLVCAGSGAWAAGAGVTVTLRDDERIVESREMVEAPRQATAQARPGTKVKPKLQPRFRFRMPANPGYNGSIIQCKKKYWGVALSGAILDLEGKDQPQRLAKALLKDDSVMVMLGYAADGFPVYNDMAPKDPKDMHSPLRRMVPGYRKRQDGDAYDYVGILGDLDECNGREGVTPEYPLGTYYYVISRDYPFVPRCWKGSPDSSFRPLDKIRPAAAETAAKTAPAKKPDPDEPF